MTEPIYHIPALLNETIDGLNIKSDGIYVDVTFGGGGHSKEILTKLGKNGKLIGFDQDEDAVKNGIDDPRFIFVRSNFRYLKNFLRYHDIEKVDGILADLGYSSIQLEDEKYGMSFLKDSPLDMRLDRNNGLTAKKVVNEYEKQTLEKIFREYGEEKFAGQIAKRIVAQRAEKEIDSTFELVAIIRQAVPERFQHQKISRKNQQKVGSRDKHPATKVFQALRIEVNRELANLKKFIPAAVESLAKNGRLVIISFHSLEDRIVKNMFKDLSIDCICPSDFPVCQCEHRAQVRLINRKPIVPETLETEENPRARSAKLRIVEKI